MGTTIFFIWFVWQFLQQSYYDHIRYHGIHTMPKTVVGELLIIIYSTFINPMLRKSLIESHPTYLPTPTHFIIVKIKHKIAISNLTKVLAHSGIHLFYFIIIKIKHVIEFLTSQKFWLNRFPFSVLSSSPTALKTSFLFNYC